MVIEMREEITEMKNTIAELKRMIKLKEKKVQ